MTVESHLAELSEKHRELDSFISEAQQHPSSDDLKVAELKREKLRIKEEIERIRQSVGQ
jgi:hypothetical protein